MEGSTLKSFVQYSKDDHFPLQNIPFGTFHVPHTETTIHCATRIGDQVVDLAVLEQNGLFNCENFTKLQRKDIFSQKTLNDFMELGYEFWHEARVTLQSLFSENNRVLQDNQDLLKKVLYNHNEVKMTLPVKIGDYTDFYSSKNHAYNVGVMIRGAENALQTNWLHLPVGYHGRASSIVVSGTEIRRPKGQVSADQKTPIWSECKRLDFELEMAAFIGKSNQLGHPVKVKDANNHIFGYTLLNDWSARDIQVWEYVPLGPFNAKNFATTISPWIITREALEPFKFKLPDQDPVPLPYLKDEQLTSYDIELNVYIKSEKLDQPHPIAKSNMKHLYWTPAQQLTHHTVTGCNLNVGDLLGSGTISGTEKGSYGSLLEISWGGKEKLQLPSGEERTFLQDGDSLILEGVCKNENYTIGFGDCSGKILPALDDSNFF